MNENTSPEQPAASAAQTPKPDFAEIARQVRDEVVERGRLASRDIQLIFSLNPDDWPELRKEVLKRYKKDLEPARGKVGGFVAKIHHRRQIPETEQEATYFELEGWQRLAISRLVELLDRKALENLVGGELRYSVEKHLEIKTGASHHRKETHANALLIKHGRDLFADKDVRIAVAKASGKANKIKVNVPDAWHPGKEAAIEFVQQCGFPQELTGLLSPDRLPDFERLEGPVVLPELQPFQKELYSQIRDRLAANSARAIASLPTGAGKTRLMVEAVKDFWKSGNAKAVAWLAHTDELCEQAYQCFREVWEANSDAVPITAIRYWGEYTRTIDKHSHALRSLVDGKVLVVSTPLRLLNALLNQSSHAHEFVAALTDAAIAIVIDEAHRAGAPTYQELTRIIKSRNDRISFFGLTATPYRTEYSDSAAGIAALQEIFQELLLPASLDDASGTSPREKLQEMGVLAELEIYELQTEVDLRLPPNVPASPDALTQEEQESVDEAIKRASDVPRRRWAILPRLKQIANEPGSSILYFGPTVSDAQAMTFLLRMEGITAEFVGAETRTPTRRQVIRDFKDGKIRVICNCEVLTTGFDAPRVTHVVIARTTVSRVLWEQMIGRGLRGEKFGGTRKCVVYDCLDNFSGDPGKVKGFYQFRESWHREFKGKR